MFNRVFHIKGSCEECGFAYKGEVPNSDGAHPAIRCPNCGLQTKNFEDAIQSMPNKRMKAFSSIMRKANWRLSASNGLPVRRVGNLSAAARRKVGEAMRKRLG